MKTRVRDLEGAIAEYRAALRINPNDATTLGNLELVRKKGPRWLPLLRISLAYIGFSSGGETV